MNNRKIWFSKKIGYKEYKKLQNIKKMYVNGQLSYLDVYISRDYVYRNTKFFKVFFNSSKNIDLIKIFAQEGVIKSIKLNL